MLDPSSIVILVIMLFMIIPPVIFGYVHEGYQQVVLDTYQGRTAHDDRFQRVSTLAWRFIEYSLGTSLMFRVLPTLIFDPARRITLSLGEVLSDWLFWAVVLLIGIAIKVIWQRWWRGAGRVRDVGQA